MKKTLLKLIAVVMALVLSVVMVVTMTYAWTTLSTAPIAEGIQISIGGGNTIMVAPNLVKTVNGETYCYPGFFEDTLNFSRYDEYAYLKTLAHLTPVSTSDGVNWFIPEYYDILDEEVLNGTASVGVLKPVSEFTVDSYLEYANITNTDINSGYYIFLDFWVVSPTSNCTLRVSSGDDSGSYLVELMSPVKGADGSFTLSELNESVAASARVGFLVNPDYVTDETMMYYQQSYAYSDQYKKLRGTYGMQGEKWYSDSYRFTIYEPNGDVHPDGTDGVYIVTSPLGLTGDNIVYTDISDRLTVQFQNRWNTSADIGISLEEVFYTAIAGKNIDSEQEAKNELYNKYLQGNYAPYITRGDFIVNSGDLYTYYSSGNIVDESELYAASKGGATESTYIVSLEKNVPQRIRMFVWIEGQDTDCTAVDAVDFALGIELAGSNQEVYD